MEMERKEASHLGKLAATLLEHIILALVSTSNRTRHEHWKHRRERRSVYQVADTRHNLNWRK